MKTYKLYWSPTGKHIATVQANSPRNAVRKAPQPYRRYPGEIYAVTPDDDTQQRDFARAIDTCVDDLTRDIAQHNAHDRTRTR